MANVDERVEMIGSSILAQAQSESRELIEKANNEREKETTSYEEQIIRDMFVNVQKQTSLLRTNTVKAVSSAQGEAKRSLLKRREELAGMVFASVKTRLFEYAKTPDYAENIKAELGSLSKAYDHSHSVVYLKNADISLSEQITKLLPGCAVEADTSIKIGGWKLLNKKAGILIDETLDTRISGQKQWLLMNSGLMI